MDIGHGIIDLKDVLMKRSIAIAIIFSMISCKEKPSSSNIGDDSISKIVSSGHEGKVLMENKCYLCHSPSAPENKGRIAPPMIAVKARYMESFEDEEAFTEAFSAFLKSPSKQNAIMWGAVDRFGVMPYQYFPEDEVGKIAEYLYDYQIEEPEWFKEHWKGHGKTPYNNSGKTVGTEDNAPLDHKEIGLKYALGTKKVLGKNLMGTIQTKGVDAALAFCNERAYTLTDSMSVHFNAKIKRVSDKPRNSKNKANKTELGYIEAFKEQVANGNSIEPVVVENNDQIDFYYPIVTNNMCLKCHGTPEKTIGKEVMKSLSRLYPNDKATGYNVNEVRGIWSIIFEKDSLH
ncbi:c-type heme family protein [Flagellimonas pacifica]|uniref:Cytochrome c domain-containing protein n=1 Tax=Flagellimonas pacifica TaxID=1247520 RepID=A0A285MDP1_9FLAO|nr:DUF3365 domain-containing protein [Allomuricauda parva]SNY95304.1 Protein of unknown function [Allomuricauda parva]